MLAVSMTPDGVVLGEVSSCIAHWQYAMDKARENGARPQAIRLLPIVRFARAQQRELGKNKAPTYVWMPGAAVKNAHGCLCGHAEWCENCRTQPPSAEELARIAGMKPEDWASAVPVVAEPQSPTFMLEAAHAMGKAAARFIDEVIKP